ncbi:MAG: DedA family protein [Rikenellaceae bacterium]|nr:DedA family protein [Rikenellaceae bacterium]
MSIIRRLYDWVLHWADTKWAVIALFLLAFAESSFFPIPPDVLLIACCLGAAVKSFRFALICTLGSVLGAILGYCIGNFAWLTSDGGFTSFAEFFFRDVFSEGDYFRVKNAFEQYNFWVVFTAGFTPLPYKIITITAGVFNINFIMFMIASIISRGMRFFLIGWLIWKYGPPIKIFIDKYFNLLAIAFTVLLVGSFVVLKYVI